MGNAVKRDYSINKRLKEYIVMHDKMPSRIADKAGIRRDIFSNILACRRVILAEELPKICESTGCSIEYLLGVEIR